MWLASKIATPAASDPVSIADAKAHCRVNASDDGALITGYISAACAHVEQYCGIRLSPVTLDCDCESFDDLARLPEGPVSSIASVTYVDAAGTMQTVSNSVYELRSIGLDGAAVLKYGQNWPAMKYGSLVTVRLVAGFSTVPSSITHAVKVLVGHWYENREAVTVENSAAMVPMMFDDLLCNYRRGV